MDFMFRFLNLLVFIDDDGKPQHLRLYPVQKFIMCAIFGLRRPDGRYLVNTANIYMARRNGKSFLLSGVLHYLMAMSKFKSEKIILASCKGQNATICFDEFVNFIDNDPFLRDTYDNVNRTACWARNKLTNNKLEMFRTGAGAKKTLDGFTNRVAIIDEEMLCDKIITKTIQDGQAHYKDRLLVTMSTAQFSIGSENHKKWLNLRAALYDDVLPDETFLFLCEPNKRDVEKANTPASRSGARRIQFCFLKRTVTPSKTISSGLTELKRNQRCDKRDLNCRISPQSNAMCGIAQMTAASARRMK